MASTSHKIEDSAYGYIKEYAHYITKHRVCPGLDLKPVQRRVLWSMIGLKARTGKGRFIKSSTIVGTALKYHPHGEGSVYSALCNLINMPNALVTGRGNYGGVYGDSPASSRYTEARTSELFEHILDEYAIELGEFVPNYDESDKESILFQSKIPIALLTGCNGIGVGLTTISPSYHIDYIKVSVKAALVGKTIDTPVYAYGGVLYDNRIYPEYKVVKKNNKDYIHITSIPIGSSAKIFNSSPLITELMSNKIIEIIDESKCDVISMYIKAPQDIQDMILDSMSHPIVNGFRYYWKKLRASGYVETWLEERKNFVKNREYFKQAKLWKEELIKACLHHAQSLDRVDYQLQLEKLVEQVYHGNGKSVFEGAKPYICSKEELLDIVRSKPISSLKNYVFNSNPVINEITDKEISDIITAEVDSVDSKLFSPATKIGTSLTYASFTNKIKRYVALRDNSIEVKFSKISRVVNWETEDNPIVIYHDGKTEYMSPYFFGIKEDLTHKVVGFTLPGSLTVVVTESNKIRVLTRLGYINEPIKSAFPAKKMIIDDKEYVIKRGMEFLDVKSYKIIET